MELDSDFCGDSTHRVATLHEDVSNYIYVYLFVLCAQLTMKQSNANKHIGRLLPGAGCWFI